MYPKPLWLLARTGRHISQSEEQDVENPVVSRFATNLHETHITTIRVQDNPGIRHGFWKRPINAHSNVGTIVPNNSRATSQHSNATVWNYHALFRRVEGTKQPYSLISTSAMEVSLFSDERYRGTSVRGMSSCQGNLSPVSGPIWKVWTHYKNVKKSESASMCTVKTE